MIYCKCLDLPKELQEAAAQRAISINPRNAPQSVAGQVAPLAVMTTKYWGANGVLLSVGFLENPPVNLRKRILQHMNAWGGLANVEFFESATHPIVRISLLGDGYSSYTGTDVLSRPPNEPTMYLKGFSMDTPESEFIRVVRHEAGHTIGLFHEHLREDIVGRIDPAKAFAYFMAPPNSWTRQQVIDNVLTILQAGSFRAATPMSDQDSIMCYHLPATIMKDGKEVKGGVDIDAPDRDFVAGQYPLPYVEQYLVGNWTGSGRKDAFAARRGNKVSYQFDIHDTFASSSTHYGNPGDQYLVGDWHGSGKDKLAVRRGDTIYYQTSLADGNGTAVRFGNGDADEYLVGDWTGNGKDRLAVRRGDTILYQTSLTGGNGTAVRFGNGDADEYLVGDWTGDGKDKLAVRRGDAFFYQSYVTDTTGTLIRFR